MNGMSLTPFLEGVVPEGWRDHVYFELDFGEPDAATIWQNEMGLQLRHSNLAVLRDENYKLVHFNGQVPPLLFDMDSDPGEMVDLSQSAGMQQTLLRMTRKLLDHRMTHADHALSDFKATANGTVRFPPGAGKV